MSVEFLHGDCRAILPGLTADVCITDPVWPNVPPGLLEGSDRPYELFNEVMQTLPPSIKRLVVILRSDSDPRFIAGVPARFKFVCLQAMSYAVPMYLGRVLGGTEIAYCFGTPIAVRPGRRVIPMWSPKAQPGARPANGHPCSRAMVHMKWLVDWWSEPGETIIDPFSGSGTIPLAAHALHRHGIGIEIEERYIELSRNRYTGFQDELQVSL